MGCGITQKKVLRTHRGSIVLFPGQFVQNLPESIYNYYEIKESLGSGSYGTVVSAVHKNSREYRAIKIINKYKLHSEESRNKVINEVLILKKIDHPNIIKIFEFYEDEFNLYVVMELCRGGELLDMIIKKGSMSESNAAIIMRQIFSAVYYMHSMNIMHRDLKLENMLLENTNNMTLKIADFGTSCEFVKKMYNTAGTVNYMAPEVIKKNYNEKCDIWSCGVILFILLTGKMPFAHKDKKQTIGAILKGEYNLDNQICSGISNEAKSLIRKLLEYNYEKRVSAELAYNDPWVQNAIVPQVSQNDLNDAMNNLATFGETSKFQRAVVRYIVSQLISQGEKGELNNIFKSFDTSGDGKINQNEFVDYCQKIFGNEMSYEEILAIMSRVDTDKSGFIDYSEFLAAALDRSKLLSAERLKSAFSAFDKEKNGKISAQSLKTMLESTTKLEISAYTSLIKEVDQDGDGLVDFGEFVNLMNRLQ